MLERHDAWHGVPWYDLTRDENGAETDGTECYHICFHIFFAEAETNKETPEMNTKTDTTGKGHGANTKRIPKQK